jgi:hypothetical protein
MRLEEKLARIKAALASKLPAEIPELFHRGTEELQQSGLAQQALTVGDNAPAFALPNTKGETVRSQALLAHGPLVVTFYRGAW